MPPAYPGLVQEHILAGAGSLTPNLSELLEPGKPLRKGQRFLQRVFVPRPLLRRQFGLAPEARVPPRYYLRRLRLLLPNISPALRLLRGDPQAAHAARRQNRIQEIRLWLGAENPQNAGTNK